MGFLINRIAQVLSETPPEEPTGDYSANVTPPARSAVPVTAERAIGLTSVYRSIEISAGVASTLTLTAWLGANQVTPTPSLVAQPDPWRDQADWIERVVVSLAADGNAFLRKHRGPNKAITSLEVLNPFLTHVRWRKGRKSYVTYDHRAQKFIDLADADVHHIWGLQLPGRTRGLGVIEACRVSLGGALDVRDYGAEWFTNTDVPSGVLSSDQNLGPADVAMYRAIWANPGTYDDDDAATLNRRLGPRVRVLGKGLSYVPIMLKPADAQWIETQKFGVLEVARMFGMPPDYLAVAVEGGSSMTYKSLETLDTSFMRLTLIPRYLRKIERALTTLSPLGQTVRFDLTDWLRPDVKTQADVDKVYLDSGVVSPQDVRDRLRIAGQAPGRPAPAAAREDTPA